MQTAHFNREQTGLFTEISNRLSYHQNGLTDYIHEPFSEEAFKQQIELKKKHFSASQRELLVKVLQNKYTTVSTTDLVKSNIESLADENTFTITTGHQLSIFTGPIYFIYKIFHVIRLAEDLKKKYPASHFVPVFWMASEDHDFEEVQSVALFNKTFKWETEQKGAVGRFSTESFEEVKAEFRSLFANHPDNEVDDFLNHYNGKNLGEATFNAINHLFKKYGLVIVDGDDAALKKSFSLVLHQELTTQFSFLKVTETSEKLQNEGIKLQINPREINLFYLDKNLRSRIQLQDHVYFIEGKGTVSKADLITELNDHPERFSPNVVLRPVYQEFVLPNLCYLGGGGEMAYWLQLKGVFDAINCPYPLIQVRNSILIVDSVSENKMKKTGLELSQLFEDTDDLKRKYVLDNSEQELDFTELDNHYALFAEKLVQQVKQIDPNLDSYIQAELTRMEKQVSSIKQKLIKTEKGKHDQVLQQIDQIKNRLFPNGGMQERSINFFSLCSDGKVDAHLNTIYEAISPFENDLIAISV